MDKGWMPCRGVQAVGFVVAGRGEADGCSYVSHLNAPGPFIHSPAPTVRGYNKAKITTFSCISCVSL